MVNQLKNISTLMFLFVVFATSPLFAAFDSARFNGQKGAIQVSINPAGEDVPAAQEIVLHFNRPIVPVGVMERSAAEVPVSIEPPIPCDWRWLNSSSLACQLSEQSPLAPATTYTVKVKKGLKASDGTVMNSEVTHTFGTARPRVDAYSFATWKAATHPVIQVTFNQPVQKGSVESHLYFQTGSGRRIPLKALEEVERKNRKKKKARSEKKRIHEGNYWFVEPKEELPLDGRVELKIETGVTPRRGKNPGAENRVVVAFDTFPNFSFFGVKCTNLMNQEFTLRPGQEARLGERCDPLKEVSLLFSAPVVNSELKDHLRLSPDLAGGRKDYDPWKEAGDHSRLYTPHVKGLDYPSPFPEMLKAAATYTLKIPAGKLRDEFGRVLANEVRMSFDTDHRKPNFAFNHKFSVLEKQVDSELPIVVTNLAQLNVKYSAMNAQGVVSSGEELLAVGPATDIAYPMPLNVREMLKAPSGIVTGEIYSAPPLPEKSLQDRWFFSQVTPYNVQIKVGHFNTLVWVTSFASGQPVAGVQVDVYKGSLSALTAPPKVINKSVTDANGIALLPGAEKLDPKLESLGYSRQDKPSLIIRCKKGKDLALIPLTEEFNANYSGDEEEWSPQYLQRKYAHIHTWGTTAQGVYKAGDTVQFKLYVRNQNNRTFVAPPLKGYSLQVLDPMGKVVHEVKKVSLSEFGSYDGSFSVPKNGAVGWYRFVLSASFKEGSWEPMQVLISDFTPAPFRVTTELNGTLFKAGDTVRVATRAKLHAGGPYANAQARITATLRPEPFVSDDPRAKGYSFDTLMDEGRQAQQLLQTEAGLDARGELSTDISIEPNEVLYGQIHLESAVRDDRGKYLASGAAAVFVGRDRFVGLLQPDWVLNVGEPARVKAVVVDEQGKVAPGTTISIVVEQRTSAAARVRGAGNAYLTHVEHDWQKIAATSLTSSTDGLEYLFTPTGPGQHRITATVTDSRGKTHTTRIHRWCAGKGQVVWESEADNSLRVMAEKKEYRVGETARFLVQNPFPGARALITIERYGVMKSWVETFSEGTATIEYTVEPDSVPGFHLSVVVVSPRVQKPLGGNRVDLGKPAFRMGYVQVPVKDPYKELVVTVTPQQKEYKPRSTVAIDLQAQPRQGDPAGAQPPMELAVAVLDEAVLDLIKAGRNYFDVYKGFYYLDPLDMKNFNILMQLVGRQKFEKKGANAGGDGGPDLSMRSSFKFVSYWNPALKTDANGKAHIEFQTPDNLTGWRVLVMAVTKGDLMGLGDGRFTVSNPIEIQPVMPNQLTEGDRVEAGFSVMNRTGQERTLEVTIEAKGPLETGGSGVVKSQQQIVAKPYQRTVVRLPLQTTGSGEITLTARAFDQTDGDAVQHRLPVLKRQSLEAAATYGSSTAREVTEQLAIPAAIRTDVGRISVAASPTVIGNLEGAFAYLQQYPYACWEQKLTKGVMAAHYRKLKEYLPKGFTWPESKTLPQDTLKLAAEHQAPGGGMSFYLASDSLASPYLSAYTALAFNWLRADGYKIPEGVETRLHDYLLALLRNNTMPSFYDKGMASTVRAVALAALAPHGKVTLEDLKRYHGHLDEMSLFGKAHYLLALLKVKGTEELRAGTARKILAHASETGGKYIFSETLNSGYKQILASTTRDNAAVLSALLVYGETPAGAGIVGDIPYKLVRTITQNRGSRDRWENTQENMFAMNALIDFQRIYERDKPAMTVSARFDGKDLGSGEFRSVRDPARDFQRPLQADDPGKKGAVVISKEGKGRFYYGVRLFYAPAELKKEAINAGIEVRREYSVERGGKWLLLPSPLQLKTGELVRVDLFLSLRAGRNFVVVDDPVPGGLEPVNRDLATASSVDEAKGDVPQPEGSFWYRHTDWIDYGFSYGSFYHKELRHQAARFYSEYLPAGNYHLSYVAQAIAPGEFTALPTHAEEMYDPDVFGKGAPAVLEVK